MADRVRMAIIGTGGMAQGHIEKLLTLPEAEIAAFVDINPLARTAARRSRRACPGIRGLQRNAGRNPARRRLNRDPAHALTEAAWESARNGGRVTPVTQS